MKSLFAVFTILTCLTVVAQTAVASVTDFQDLKTRFEAATKAPTLADFPNYPHNSNTDLNCSLVYQTGEAYFTGVYVIEKTTPAHGPLIPSKSEKKLFIGVSSGNELDIVDTYFDKISVSYTAHSMTVKTLAYFDSTTPLDVEFHKSDYVYFKTSNNGYGYCY